jgi:membrane protein implicated in regulation of membrane protease activity
MIATLDPGLWWFIVGLVCIAAEVVLPGFIIVFFGVGAWVTAILHWFGVATTFDAQLIVFLVSTVLSLVLFRRKGKKYFEGKVSGKMGPGGDLEEYVNEQATVTVDIPAGGAGGRVEFHGTPWSATSTVEIKKGTPVKVLRRQNLTLHVQPL